ncbi:MAG: Iron-sulfur cluster carrier protein [Chlamydiae bacterium]|nr:Iron-sulfur cluster carrier protein [Chlamydiota bacterium]
MKVLANQTLVIGSGKGGVGKSTVTVNLAVALGRLGYSVGVLDADLYGPSIPIMTGLRELSPQIIFDGEGKEKFLPFEKFGIKIISIGFFLEESRSILWRGPMLHGMLQKMVSAVEWGELDLLLIDLPPGTGDVPLSLSQILKIDGAIIVTTPQEVAILDAIKAIHAFDQLKIPLMGIVENMAGFTVPGTSDTYSIFGEGKAQELAHRYSVPLLESIPLIPAIRRGGDDGYPSAFHNGDDAAGRAFRNLGTTMMTLNQRNPI